MGLHVEGQDDDVDRRWRLLSDDELSHYSDDELDRLATDNGDAPVAQPPRTRWTATELVATEFPEPRWAVPSTIPEGFTLLSGAPKLGKSWLALHLCLAVASGGMALGSIPVERGQVLYLALEDGPRRLRDRLLTLLGDEPTPEGLHFDTEWPLFGNGGGGQLLDQRMSEIDDLRMVVLDVVTRVREPSYGEPIYDRDYRTGSQLKHLADRHGTAIVGVHHDRKADAEDFVDRVSGSHGLTGAADTVAALRRSRTEADAELSITGRDVPEAAHALKFDPQLGTWTLEGEVAELAMSPQRRAILAAVQAGDGLGPKAIAEESGVAYDTVRQLVTRMADAGQLDTDGAGHYLPPHPPSQRSPHSQPTVNSEQSERGEGGPGGGEPL